MTTLPTVQFPEPTCSFCERADKIVDRLQRELSDANDEIKELRLYCRELERGMR